ncbi:NmrA family transcriptional regulator [Humibacillus sp. DSM 29435]|uniref:SDR family oxidoreductase n=1 Tax=Humibacillus sp. DSM 29435 TaxID=1869167 RepID=UPI000871D2C6|nr:NAD(P)-binding oxidoreductase [Humibacillus sp. DSM 29435]OFE15684.1 NmrA family transcriptional regulator [Humibacillus sp. DSM 29435]
MSAPILLTGGTGTLGHLIAPILRENGHDVRILSRSPHKPADGIELTIGDLSTGDGIAAAVSGVDTIVHCAGTQQGDDEKTHTLTQAALATGRRPHLVYISVVGANRVPVITRIDRTMFGYFASKRAAEEIVTGSGLPWTTLRATQFHDLTLTAVQAMAKLPIVPVPSGTRFQPVDAREVAARLVELALGEPAGTVRDFAGPRIYPMKELLRTYLAATGKHRLLMPMRLPVNAARAIREGANLAPERTIGRRTWESFLAERVST